MEKSDQTRSEKSFRSAPERKNVRSAPERIVQHWLVVLGFFRHFHHALGVIFHWFHSVIAGPYKISSSGAALIPQCCAGEWIRREALGQIWPVLILLDFTKGPPTNKKCHASILSVGARLKQFFGDLALNCNERHLLLLSEIFNFMKSNYLKDIYSFSLNFYTKPSFVPV